MQIGHFETKAVLGEGGMGIVYLAEDRHLQRLVALKVITPALAQNPLFHERFIQEARSVAALDHPGIINIYAFDPNPAQPYLVMELIRGAALERYLAEMARQGRPLELQDALLVGIQAAEALDYAHSRGIIHRDVKPGNLLLKWRDTADTSGKPQFQTVVVDFGLAILLDEAGAGRSPEGSLAYMSPEQLRGETVDDRSDLYSLGVVLYQLLTGRPPFNISNWDEAREHHSHTPPPAPEAIHPDIPAAVSAVLLKAIAKAPGERFQSAADLAAALRFVLESLPAQPTRQTPTISLAALRSVVATFDEPEPISADPDETVVTPVPAAVQEFEINVEPQRPRHPEPFTVLIENKGNASDRYLVRLETAATGLHIEQPETELYVQPGQREGVPLRVAAEPALFQHRSLPLRLSVVSALSGEKESAITVEVPPRIPLLAAILGVGIVLLLLLGFVSSIDALGCRLQPARAGCPGAEGTSIVTATPPPSPTALPLGTVITPTPTPLPVPAGEIPPCVERPASAASNVIIFDSTMGLDGRGGPPKIFRFDVDGNRLPQPIPYADAEDLDMWDRNPALSPDGAWILFESAPGHSSTDFQLRAMRLDGSGLTNLLADGRMPAWSPFGNQIAYVRSERDESIGDIWIAIVEATAEGLRLSEPIRGTRTGNLTHPSWACDNQRLAVNVRDANGRWQIGVIDVPGEAPRLLTSGGELDNRWPAWSPDGKLIAYHEERVEGAACVEARIMLIEPDSDNPTPRRLTDGECDRGATWSPDSSEIVFHRYTGDGNPKTRCQHNVLDCYQLFRVPIDGSAEPTLLTLTEGESQRASWGN